MTSADWLALCLVTESNEPSEWVYIAWCIRNRVLSDRYPTNVRDVVLQRRQFSHFNAFEQSIKDMRMGKLSELSLYQRVMAGIGDTSHVRRLSADLVDIAKQCADEILREGIWRRPFSGKVMHYYSPISMIPKGSEPAWASDATRRFTPGSIDPERFVFAEGVA